MKLIILRGLPGSGKSELSNRIAKKLKNSKVICVDELKIKFKNKGFSWTDSRKKSYDLTIKKIKTHNKNKISYLIIEEILCDKIFYKSLKKSSKNKKYWFLIERNFEDLLKVEEERKREIKNSLRDLKYLDKEIKKIKIPNEIVIDNKEIEKSVNEIIKKVK